MSSQKRTGLEGNIQIIIESQAEPGEQIFEASPQLAVGAFLNRVMERLTQGENAARVKAMLEYYDPVLELLKGESATPLNNSMTLHHAGVTDQAVCRIAAKPRKEKIMFCRNS